MINGELLVYNFAGGGGASTGIEIATVEVCRGHPVALAWFSPDCKHFSKAKGGKQKDKHIRGLAWVALVRPRVIILENVEEFKTWGSLNRCHRPIKA